MYQLIVFLPLIGALLAGLLGTNAFRMMGRTVDGGHGHGDHGHAAHDAGHHDHHDDHAHHAYPTPWAAYLTCGFMVVSAVLSWVAFWQFMHEGTPVKIEVLRWISSGALSANWAFRIDTLTAVMLVVVNTVSSLVHIYSIGYMSHD